jgi:hypothetical protein
MKNLGYTYSTHHGEPEMTKSMAAVIPIRRAQSRKIDLALALAMFDKAVTAHARARRLKLALAVRSAFGPIDG